MNETKTPHTSVELTSADLVQEQKDKLKQLFPEVFSEGKVDWEKLRATLGEAVASDNERFTFTWAGKQEAMTVLQTPSRATLVPCPEESVDFDATENLFIEGDNLEVLKLLFKPYFGRVKMIYIDPPYNTGQDFIYPDNYADPLSTYLRLTGQVDSEGNLLTSNPETSGRYHSAWLSMMYPRLFLARQLLRDDGVIFVSIDDHEVHHLRMLMNEVFGEENFVATVIWQKIFSAKNTARHFSEDHDYILVYARNAEEWTPEALPRTEEANARYGNPDDDERGPWSSSDLTARNYYGEGLYEVSSPSGKVFSPSKGNYWRVKKEKFLELDKDNRIWWGNNGDSMPRLKRFLSDVKQGMVPQTLWKYKDVGHTQEAKKELMEFVNYEHTDNVLDTVKPSRLLQRMLLLGTKANENNLVVDFFAGSCSTGQAVLQQNLEDGGNRRFICIQLPEKLYKPEKELKTLADVGKERIRRVIGKLKEEDKGQLEFPEDRKEDLGFKVFKLAESNVRPWDSGADRKPEDYLQYLGGFTDPLVTGWKPVNVIWEMAIKEGYGLNSRIEKLDKIKENTVWKVTDPDKEQSFRICLDDKVHPDISRILQLGADDLFICRDTAIDDTIAANLALQCRLKTI